jgi:hypothetical protein
MLLAFIFQGELEIFTTWLLYVEVVLVVFCGMIWVIRLKYATCSRSPDLWHTAFPCPWLQLLTQRSGDRHPPLQPFQT